MAATVSYCHTCVTFKSMHIEIYILGHTDDVRLHLGRTDHRHFGCIGHDDCDQNQVHIVMSTI